MVGAHLVNTLIPFICGLFPSALITWSQLQSDTIKWITVQVVHTLYMLGHYLKYTTLIWSLSREEDGSLLYLYGTHYSLYIIYMGHTTF